jgi:hypothetical protein
LVNSQTCETRHEESWHWIGNLAYNMLYHARRLAENVSHPWEKRKIQVISGSQRPTQVQRDYKRIIREIGTPAPVPKTRGKSPGRQTGCKGTVRPEQPLIRKSNKEDGSGPSDQAQTSARKEALLINNKHVTKQLRQHPRQPYKRMQRISIKNCRAPMRC